MLPLQNLSHFGLESSYNPSMNTRPDIAALERLLAPLTRGLNLEAARTLVDFQVDPETVARIDQLSEGCTAGTLTDIEMVEYETYVRAIDLITILQLQARAMLADSTAA